MKESRFRILMHCGSYVDANMLESGIYASNKPFIYDKSESIQSLIEKAQKVKDFTGTNQISERYFDNLKQCQLVDFTILPTSEH